MRVRARERWFTEPAQCRADLPERQCEWRGGEGEEGKGVSQPMNNHYTTESSPDGEEGENGMGCGYLLFQPE